MSTLARLLIDAGHTRTREAERAMLKGVGEQALLVLDDPPAAALEDPVRRVI